jgi:hypothetical protein
LSRKVFLHVGLPKTGSTALQALLYENAATLDRSLVHYDREVHSAHDPKHQWLLKALRKPEEISELSLDRFPASAKSIVLSSESLTNEFPRFEPVAVSALSNALKKLGSLEILLVVRDSHHWARSYYKQAIVNQPSSRMPFYSTTMTYRDFVKLEPIRFLMNSNLLRRSLQDSFDARVLNFDYGEQSSSEILDVISQGRRLALQEPPARKNVSIDDVTAEAMRQVNMSISSVAEKSAWSYIFQAAGSRGSTTMESLAARTTPEALAAIDLSVLRRLKFQDNSPLEIDQEEFGAIKARLINAFRQVRAIARPNGET